MNKRKIGSIGEDFSVDYLNINGYKILERNFRAGKIGEIDIIATIDKTICFIEVKARKNLNYGLPSEAITKSKVKNIRLLANIFLNKHKLQNSAVRFDVIEVYLENIKEEEKLLDINHIQNAF